MIIKKKDFVAALESVLAAKADKVLFTVWREHSGIELTAFTDLDKTATVWVKSDIPAFFSGTGLIKNLPELLERVRGFDGEEIELKSKLSNDFDKVFDMGEVEKK